LTLHAIGVGGECFEGNLHGWGGIRAKGNWGVGSRSHKDTKGTKGTSLRKQGVWGVKHGVKSSLTGLAENVDE
jgi:hypothetical protein